MQDPWNFFRNEALLKQGDLLFFTILPLIVDKCSIKTTVRKVYELKLQPSYIVWYTDSMMAPT